MNHSAHEVLKAEAHNLEANVARSGRLDLSAYPWEEPHHRFTDPHIDPYFVQVFDAEGRLLRASANVTRLGGDFPARILPASDDDLGLGPLRTFEAGGALLYHRTTLLRTRQGQELGYLQIARYEPGIAATVRRLGFGIAAGYLVVLAGLLALLWTVGGRVVRPLEAITAKARDLSPEGLSQRVPVPPEADRETAELGGALNAALARLERAFDEIRRFTANAAHELQTPLTVLLGHIEVALRRERPPEAYRETLHVLQEETEELVRMVRGLLALTHMDEALQPSERVDLDQITCEEVDLARARAEAKGLRLTVEADAGADVLGHPALLREAVRNLLDNAVKYTDAGEVRVGVRRLDGQVTLAVEDTGMGIAPEHLGHVRGRFWRAGGVQHLPGSGLGLALVEQVAAHHGGRLFVHSDLGAGTRAEVRLPEANGHAGRGDGRP